MSLPLWFAFNSRTGAGSSSSGVDWIPSIGAQYFLGVDGFSALLILLTTLIGAIARAVVVDGHHRRA